MESFKVGFQYGRNFMKYSDNTFHKNFNNIATTW